MAKSIREYVSESELIFELYKLKYSKSLRDIKELSSEEIIQNFEKNKQKRITSIGKDFIKYSSDPKILESLQYNLNYIETLKPLLLESQVFEIWEEKVSDFNEYLQERQITYPESELILSEKVSKERFGSMLMLIVSNLGTKPCFGTYTRNWKDDFYSNAIENTLEFLHNFDNKLLSKRTGKPMKAFAYITQISFNAFVAVIKTRKKEQLRQKTILPYEVALVEGNISFKDLNLFQDENDYYFEEFSLDYDAPIQHIQIQDDEDDIEESSPEIDELDEDVLEIEDANGTIEDVKFQDGLEIRSNDTEYITHCLTSIQDSNNNWEYNRWVKSEFNRLQKETPAEDKTQDFYDFLEDFKPKETPFKETKSVTIVTDDVHPYEGNFSFSIRVKRA